MNDYAKRHTIFDEDFDLFNLFVSAMDSRFIELVKEKKPKTPPKGPKSKRVAMGEPEE